MIEINLLPKDYRKKSLSFSMGKTGVFAVAGGVGVVIMLFVVTLFQLNQISNLDENIQKAKQRASMLQKDIRVVDGLIDVKNKITQRMNAVEKLDSHRSSWVRIMEDMARNVPEFVWMQKFEDNGPKQAGTPVDDEKSKNRRKKKEKQAPSINENLNAEVRNVKIEGYSFTLNALASFMINMMRSDYFDNVELTSTEEKKLDNQDNHKAYNFILTCDLHFLSDEKLRGMVASVNSKKQSQKGKTSHKVLN
ncbi:MAG: hypothetical protein DRP35_03075 [Candidatus Zixiibacteriota bacterium]|nr:MAG: hypothetical protein DRP35_03075 [candidate division Zixibacteria bacterium]